MKKSLIIATCLKNSGSPYDLKEIETSIEQTFKEDFPGMSYQQWNSNVDESTAQAIIRDFGTRYRIDIRQFIQDMM
jgi:hypothetical protein